MLYLSKVCEGAFTIKFNLPNLGFKKVSAQKVITIKVSSLQIQSEVFFSLLLMMQRYHYDTTPKSNSETKELFMKKVVDIFAVLLNSITAGQSIMIRVLLISVYGQVTTDIKNKLIESESRERFFVF